MGPIDLLVHIANFAAPALAVGALLALAARWWPAARRRPWWLHGAVNSAVGLAVLAGGLWFYGRDGKMATYAVLVLACATSQWLLLRGRTE